MFRFLSEYKEESLQEAHYLMRQADPSLVKVSEFSFIKVRNSVGLLIDT